MEATDKRPRTNSKRALKQTRKQEARRAKGTVEAKEAGTDSTAEFQWGEHDDSGLKEHIEYIN